MGGWGSGAVEQLGRKTRLASGCTCSLQSLVGSSKSQGCCSISGLLGKGFGDTHQHFAVGRARVWSILVCRELLSHEALETTPIVSQCHCCL